MALVTVGDKIGISAPTVGGSTDLWGGEQNSNTFPELDEHVYAPREDRNLVITGGGKISWDSGTGQVSFTGNIVIYNHITANTVSITTAGSPVTLDTALKVGYVKINRKPSSNQSITAVTVAAAGALPNTNSDADAGVLVLFMRTSDSTLWIPWARKEILSSDYWTFGAGLSFLERAASIRKPGFNSNSADTSQVIVPASASVPAGVFIDGKLYVNTANATMDLDTAGRNGLDTGAKAATTPYYLYAIPAASGRTFDVVCSVTAPSGAGPTGFSSWSYLGAFVTVSASAINPFFYQDGFYSGDVWFDNTANVTSVTATADTISPCPSTIKKFYGRVATFSNTTVGRLGTVTGQNSTSGTGIQSINQTSGGQDNYAYGFFPAINGATVYLFVNNADATVRFYAHGFIENTMDFK